MNDEDVAYWRKVDAEDAAHQTEQRVWRTGFAAFVVGCCVGWLLARLLGH